jgi:hypothetical protein
MLKALTITEAKKKNRNRQKRKRKKILENTIKTLTTRMSTKLLYSIRA